MGMRITFLGTGGGRHTTMYQTRCTGGMIFEHTSRKHLHIDPGPGAVTQMKRIHYDPALTDSVIVSHAHPDHYSDAEVVIEGLTFGGWKKRGRLYGSPTVMEGGGTLGPCISKYHMSIIGETSTLHPGDILNIDGLETEICYAEHSDPTNIGFKFKTDCGIVSYVSDTSYSEKIAEQYKGTRVLILPITTPDDLRIPYHMCTEDAMLFVEHVKPELAVFTHLGIVMIKRGPHIQAEKTEKKTGIRTVAAKDLMVLDIGDDISISEAMAYNDEWIPPSSI